MEITDIITPETKVLAVVAHPDDFEDYWGGTMLKLLEAGQAVPANIFVVVATNGGAGGRNTYRDSETLITLRHQEQLASLAQLGIPAQNLVMLDFQDGSLDSHDNQLLDQVVLQIRQLQPDLVLTHNPDARILHLEGGDYYTHRDHRELGAVVLDGVYPFSRDLLFFPHHGERGSSSHTVTRVLLSESAHSNVAVDITDYLQRKLDLFAVHASQIVSREQQLAYFQKLHAKNGRYIEQFEYVEIFN
jgi:LmbE family N-acetylglucosaminyl deacetylase